MKRRTVTAAATQEFLRVVGLGLLWWSGFQVGLLAAGQPARHPVPVVLGPGCLPPCRCGCHQPGCGCHD